MSENKPVKLEDYGNDLVRVLQEINIILDYKGIVRYEGMKAELTNLSLISAPMYMRDFNEACGHVSRVLTKVRIAYSQATKERRAEEARAVLERAPKYFEEHKTLENLKDSTTLRNHYVHVDEKFNMAYEKQKALEALVQFLEDKLDEFKRDHYTAKAIFDDLSKNPDAHSSYNGMTSKGKIGDVTND